MFLLQIKTDNAAFEENKAREVARILRSVADRIESANELVHYFQNEHDINGNAVCSYAEKSDDYILKVK